MAVIIVILVRSILAEINRAVMNRFKIKAVLDSVKVKGTDTGRVRDKGRDMAEDRRFRQDPEAEANLAAVLIVRRQGTAAAA